MTDGPPVAEPNLPFGTRKTRAPSRWRLLATWLPALIAVPALIGGVIHYGSLEKFFELARTARPEWLLPALAAQIATYFFASLSWWQVLTRAGQPRPLPYKLAKPRCFTAVSRLCLIDQGGVQLSQGRGRIP